MDFAYAFRMNLSNHVSICVTLSIEMWFIITLEVRKWQNCKEEKL